MEEEATLLFSQQQFTNLHATGVLHTAKAGETKPRYSARSFRWRSAARERCNPRGNYAANGNAGSSLTRANPESVVSSYLRAANARSNTTCLRIGNRIDNARSVEINKRRKTSGNAERLHPKPKRLANDPASDPAATNERVFVVQLRR